MKIIKQKTCEGCLPASLLTLINKKGTLKAELSLLMGGFKRTRESYALGILDEFSHKFEANVTVYVDNGRYLKQALKIIDNPRIMLRQAKIDRKFLDRIDRPFILSLDAFSLHKDVHWPHYVIIEVSSNGFFSIIDPWNGQRRNFDKAKALKGIISLRNHLKFCPIVIKLNPS